MDEAAFNFTLDYFPIDTRLYYLKIVGLTGPRWPGGYRLRTAPQRSRVRIPGAPVERHRDPYIPHACRLQWATIRCGKHVHADYMSLNMILTAISHAVSTVRRVSRSAVYYTHQTNSLPLSKP